MFSVTQLRRVRGDDEEHERDDVQRHRRPGVGHERAVRAEPLVPVARVEQVLRCSE